MVFRNGRVIGKSIHGESLKRNPDIVEIVKALAAGALFQKFLSESASLLRCLCRVYKSHRQKMIKLAKNGYFIYNILSKTDVPEEQNV